MNRIITFFLALFLLFSTTITSQTDTLSLFDDFQDGDTVNVWGGAWKVLKGGVADNINFEMTDEEGYGRTKGSMHVSGRFSAYGAVEGWLDTSETEIDISAFDGISFVAKAANGSQVTARVRVRDLKAETDRGWSFMKYDFVPTEEWTVYNIPWDSLSAQYGDSIPPFDGTDVKAIDFGAAAASESVDIYVDNLFLWRGTPPAEIPTDEYVSLFDDFEDGDTLNTWGGPWKVLKGGVADNINFEMVNTAGYGRSSGSMHVTGRYSAFGAVESWLDSSETAQNISIDFDGISFAAKAIDGSQVTARVRVRDLKAETDRGWSFMKYDFVPTEEWTLYNLPWDSLSPQYGDPIPPFDGTDVKAIDFESAAASESIDILVDNIKFWRVTPPQPIPLTDTLVIFDNFEDGDTLNTWGGAWNVLKGGVADNINFEMTSKDAYRSSGSMKVSGRYSAFGAVEGWLDSSETAQNISIDFDGISFAAKAIDGSQVTARVRVRDLKAETDRGWSFMKYDFVPTEEWTLYNLPWDSLSPQYGDPIPPFDGTDVKAIDFGAAAASENINIYVDDLLFWRGTPPVMKPLTDSVAIFDNFEDGDTATVWGGPWNVFKGGVADNITFEMVNGNGHNKSDGSMYVHGKYASYGGVVGSLNNEDLPENLEHEFDGIAFAAKAANGSDVTVRVRIRELKAETDRGWGFFKYDFVPTENWTSYNLPWDSLTVMYGDPIPPFDATDIKAVDIAAAAASEVVDVFIDDIVFWRGTPPLITDVEDIDGVSLPTEFLLTQNYPNPFNPSTKIEFSIPKNGMYTLRVYNVLGQQVLDLVNESMKPGVYNVSFNANNLTSGVYVYQLTGNGVKLSKKMMLLK